MISRANQLKKAREDFFLGKESSPGSQPENSPSIARPTSLPIKLEKDHSNQGSPTSDKVTIIAVGGIQKLRRQEGVGGWSVKCLR